MGNSSTKRRLYILLAAPFALVALYVLTSHAIEALRNAPSEPPLQLRAGGDTTNYNRLVELGESLDESFMKACDMNVAVTESCQELLAEHGAELDSVTADILSLDLQPQDPGESFFLRQPAWTESSELGFSEIARLSFALLARVRDGCDGGDAPPKDALAALNKLLMFLLDAPPGFLQLIFALEVNKDALAVAASCSNSEGFDESIKQGARFDPLLSFRRTLVANSAYHEHVLSKKESPILLSALGLYHERHMVDLLGQETLPWFGDALPPRSPSVDPMDDWWWLLHDPMGRFNFSRHMRNDSSYVRFYNRMLELSPGE